MRAARLAVHALARGHVALAELFGGQTGDEIDKFSRCDWVAADDGTPILTAPRTWFLGAIRERIDFGDHIGCVLDPERWHDGGILDHLTVRDLEWLEPGHPIG
jgi:flavin reductase (DIM6/NTAB) family NADH-FMN oxidoreductase RutF